MLDKYCIRYDGMLFSKNGLQWPSSQKLNRIDSQILESHMSQIDTINGLVEKTNAHIAELAVDYTRIEMLLGFCGIDYYSAMLLLHEIGDIARFSNPKKLVSWVGGLAPSLYQSGNTTYNGRITKRGNKRIRWCLNEAAQNAARYDPKLKPFYNRIKKRRGAQKATVAVARKILVSIYYVLTIDEQYDGNREDLQKRKINKLRKMAQNQDSMQ